MTACVTIFVCLHFTHVMLCVLSLFNVCIVYNTEHSMLDNVWDGIIVVPCE